MKEIDVVKKQKIEEETKVLGKLMPQHLGLWCYRATSLCPMSILSWNYRRFGNPWTVGALKRALHDEAPNSVFLMETKLLQERVNFLKHELHRV